MYIDIKSMVVDRSHDRDYRVKIRKWRNIFKKNYKLMVKWGKRSLTQVDKQDIMRWQLKTENNSNAVVNIATCWEFKKK